MSYYIDQKVSRVSQNVRAKRNTPDARHVAHGARRGVPKCRPKRNTPKCRVPARS